MHTLSQKHYTVFTHLNRPRRCQMTHTTPQKILQHTYTIPSSERMIDNAGKCTHCLKSITLSLHISIVRDDARRLIQCPEILQCAYTIPSSERMIDNAGQCTHCLKSITLSLHISIVRDDARRLIQCPEILQCAYTIPSSERMIDNAGQCT